MNLKRVLAHLSTPHRRVQQAFPRALLTSLAETVTASEKRHRGELRFVVEGSMELAALLRGESPRQRAEELFSRLRVWDTEHNCGVLIYVQWVERKLEVVADRGISARVPREAWQAICTRMEKAFASGDFKTGSLGALEDVTRLLEAHYPSEGTRSNELPDPPLVM